MTKARIDTNGQVLISCPGCDDTHVLNVSPTNGRPCWSWNGDRERPTFSPSLLVRSGHHITGQPQPPNCHICNNGDPHDSGYKCGTCHSFIRDGMIEFLSDSTHGLAGQTVSLPDFQWPQ